MKNAANKVHPSLGGMAHIYSDSLGALGRVIDLPADRIPASCKHGDVLKILMVQCTDLTFSCRYSHVAAHQDDAAMVSLLERPAQLNCYMDGLAKVTLWSQEADNLPRQRPLPLEPVVVYSGNSKLTTGMKNELTFWVSR